jgi:hypothetical protein
VFVYIAACWAVTAAAIGVLGPRTGDVSLEELEQAAVGGEEGTTLGTVTDKELRYGA